MGVGEDVNLIEGHIAEAAMSVNAAIRRLNEAKANFNQALDELELPQLDPVREYFTDLTYEIHCNISDAQKGIQKMDAALKAAKLGGGS